MFMFSVFSRGAKPPRLLYLLFSLLIFWSCDTKTRIIADGKSDYRIFVAGSASAAEKTAAQQLQFYLKKISGVELAITHDTIDKEKTIYIGFDGVPSELLADTKTEDFDDEEYLIRSDGRRLLIAGGRPRGTLYGVVGYLSDHLGCRWYTQTIEQIPSIPTLSLTKIEDRQKPDFRYREVNWREAYEENWSMHNRVIPSRLPIPDSLGGSFVIYPHRGHTFDHIIPPSEYFRSHPEYFSEINGKRTADDAQLCLTNPEVVNLTIAKVLEWARQRPDANVYSVSQNDNELFCTCDKCSAIDKEEGSPAGTLIHFLNRVSEAVSKVKPDIQLQTFAYTYSEVPPKMVKPADNILIELCHYNYCSAHAIGECKDHDRFTTRLESWKQIAKNVTVWGYYVNFGFYLMPFPNLEALKKDVKYYRNQKTYGLYAEGCNIIGPQGGGEFSELKAWVFAQLMWNADKDPEKLIDEYLRAVYGPAANPIRQYIDLLQAEVADSNAYFNIWSSPVDVKYLSPETIATADQLFIEARTVAAGDEALLKRIEIAWLPIAFTKLYYNQFGAGDSYIKDGKTEVLAGTFDRIIKEKQIDYPGSNESMPNLLNELVAKAKVNDHFYKDWWIAGPYPSDENRSGFHQMYAPETKVDTVAVLSLPDGSQMHWQKHKTTVFPYVDFASLLKPNENVVAYAYRNVHLAEAKTVKIGVGSNDGIKVWINNRLVINKFASRRAAPNQDIVEVTLNKGNNDILVKVDQLGLGWGFYFAELQD